MLSGLERRRNSVPNISWNPFVQQDYGRPQVTRLLQRLTVLATLVLVACGPPAASASRTSAPDRSAPAGQVAATDSPSPAPSPSAPIFGPCQLPVWLTGPGWLSFPGGQFQPDASAQAAENPGAGTLATTVAWDSAIGKWLPTGWWMISPDGTAYIDGRFEVVSATTGAVIRNIPSGPYDVGASVGLVFAWTRAGIYIASTGKKPVPGLWRFDPATGVLSELPNSAYANWSLVDDAAAWASAVNSDNSTSFLRLDLSTGVRSTVYTTPPNQWAVPLGFVGSGVFALVTDGRILLSALVVNPDGVETPVALPAALVGALGPDDDGTIQDGTTILWSGHWVGLDAFDPIHGAQVLVPPSGQDLTVLGKCKYS